MPDFLGGLEPAPQPVQWRLTAIKLFNWGTYKGPHHAVISRDGHLITGPSGNGKSTLIDATSALLFSNKDQDFNAAARDASQKGSDRNVYTYVRGAYAGEEDAEGKAALKYLRNTADWSAISMEYTDEAGSVVSLVKVFRVSESASSKDQVQSAYMVFKESVKLSDFQMTVRAGIDVGVLRRTFHPHVVTKDFPEYQQALMDLFGIRSTQAFKLLQKLQAIKGIETLDDLMSEYMLDKPGTGIHADKALIQFHDTASAFAAVQRAKSQRDYLRPLRSLAADRDSAAAAGGALMDQLASVDRMHHQHAAEALTGALDAARHAAGRIDANVAATESKQTQLETEAVSLTREYDAAGGGDLRILEERLSHARRDTDRKVQARAKFDKTVSSVDLPAPADRSSFDLLVSQAEELKDAARGRGGAEDDEMFRTNQAAKEARDALKAAKAELASLEDHSSNIWLQDRELRDRISRNTNVPVEDLPFAGELMQVRDGEDDWAGAIERVLNSFSRAVLVPAEHYGAVSRYVNDNQLQGRIDYYRVDNSSGPDSDDTGTILGKLDFADHRFAGWVRGRIARTYNHRCVDTVGELEQEVLAVTREGLYRSRGDRHVKDDRTAVGNRRFWILGFENTARKEYFTAEVARLEAQHAELTDAAVEAMHAQQSRHIRNAALDVIIGQDWDDIDADAAIILLQDLDREHEAFIDNAPDLKAVELRRQVNADALTTMKETLKLAHGRQHSAHELVTSTTADLASELEAAASMPEPEPDVAAAINARVQTNLDGKTVKALSAEFDRIRNEIRDEALKQRSRHERATNAAISVFTGFAVKFDEAVSDVDETIASLPEFLAKLDKIEHDRLPELEDRFRSRMRKGPLHHLTDLLTALRSERKDIDKRIAPINDTLAETPFNDGTTLRIVVKPKPVPELQEFTRDVHRFIQSDALPDDDTAEERFALLESIAERLDSGDAWRRRVLDVRNHVEFVAEELDDSGTRVDWHTSGLGRSGGQRFKLVAFALAAALKFQLADHLDSLPIFGCIIIDEAFAKADSEFTKQTLDAFVRFGFQLVLATPNKMIMTFEPYVGGATIVDLNKKEHSSRPITVIGKQKLALVASIDDRQLTAADRALLAADDNDVEALEA